MAKTTADMPILIHDNERTMTIFFRLLKAAMFYPPCAL